MFMASWLPSYALSINAIIVSPDHRLLPSASSANIIEDLESLWSWAHSSLPSVLASRAPGHTVDLDRILVEGGSAGGFCAAHLGLTHYKEVKAVIIIYGMLDMFSNYFKYGLDHPDTKPSPLASPRWTGEELDQKIKEAKEAGWTSERITVLGEKSLGSSIFQGGRILDFFEGRKLDSPVERVRLDKNANLPPRT